MERALLIQTAFIGDVILTTPLIASFRRHFPDTRLSVLVTPQAASLLRNNPALEEVLIIDKKGRHRGLLGMLRLLQELRNRKFDVLLSPHKSHRTGFLAMFSGIKRRYGYQEAGFSRFAYTRRLKRPLKEPEIRRLLYFLDDSLKVGRNEPENLLLYETEESRGEALRLLGELPQTSPPILLAPSSVWPTKRWPPWRFAALAGLLVQEYRAPVLLVGSPGDHEIAEETMNYLREFHPPRLAERVFNICGKTSLLGLYSLMTRSRLLVSNDSAPVHIGCAAGIPVAALFGPTTPSLGYAPIAPRTAVAELTDLKCRPCGTHGGLSCPLEHFRCMKDLTPESVMSLVKKLAR